MAKIFPNAKPDDNAHLGDYDEPVEDWQFRQAEFEAKLFWAKITDKVMELEEHLAYQKTLLKELKEIVRNL